MPNAKPQPRRLRSRFSFENIWIHWPIRFALFTALLACASAALFAIESLGSLRDPSFYRDRIQRAGAYEFMSQELTASIVDEMGSIPLPNVPPGLDDDALALAGLEKQDLVDSASSVVSAAWLQETIEDRLGGPVDWLAGRREAFSVHFAIGERFQFAVFEANDLIEKADTEGLMFNLPLGPKLEGVEPVLVELGVVLDSDHLVEALRTAFPQEWIERQAAAAVEEAAPYFRGESDSFQVRIALEDRSNAAAEAVEVALSRTEQYDEPLGGLVESVVISRLSENDEFWADESAISEFWQEADLSQLVQTLQPQSRVAITEILRYMTGGTDDLLVNIDLRELKEMLGPQLVDFAEGTFDGLVLDAPDCDPLVTRVQFSYVPTCIPIAEPGRTRVLDEIERNAAEVASRVDDVIDSSIMDELSFTEIELKAYLQEAIGDHGGESIDEFRSWWRRGLVYTDTDLRADLAARFGAESVENLDAFRAMIRDGVEFTDQDLKNALSPADAELLNRTRIALRLAPWLAAAMSLAAISFATLIGLSVRGSRRRQVIWAAGSGAIACGIIFAATGPFYTSREPALQSSLLARILPARVNEGAFPKTVKSSTAKVVEIAMSISRGYLHGVAAKAAIATGVALAVAAAGTLRYSNLRANRGVGTRIGRLTRVRFRFPQE